LYLGPLIDDILDDFTVALVLAQQSIKDLTINYPINLEALEMLGQQCGGLPKLNQLQYLQMRCTNHAAEVLTLLLSLTQLLRLFYLMIYPSDTDEPWVMPTAGFEALTQLSCLSDSSIRFEYLTEILVRLMSSQIGVAPGAHFLHPAVTSMLTLYLNMRIAYSTIIDSQLLDVISTRHANILERFIDHLCRNVQKDKIAIDDRHQATEKCAYILQASHSSPPQVFNIPIDSEIISQSNMA
ncbi:hypothetical protein KCU78_g6270, partial [Aureobasidium melanogenum]